jgi:hypothetical protein
MGTKTPSHLTLPRSGHTLTHFLAVASAQESRTVHRPHFWAFPVSFAGILL